MVKENELVHNIEQINFKAIGFFTPLFGFLLVIVVAGCGGAIWGAFNADKSQHIFYIVISGFVILFVLFLLRYFTWRKWAAPIQFCANTLHLPRRQNAKTCDEIAYKDVKSIDIRGNAKRQVLLVATEKRNYLFALKNIKENRAQIEALIQSSILRSEGGLSIWQQLQQNQNNAKILTAKKSKVALGLTLLIGFIYFLTWWTGGANLLNLVYLGANSAVLVDAGQWGRLFTANFLHAGLLHIYLNAINLLIIGAVLEKLVGWQKFLSIYLLSCLGGAWVSYLVGSSIISVGASTGIFGLLGSLLYINVKMGFRLPAGFNFGKRSWIIILGINIVLPFLVPQIDWAAHVGGFATGLIITWCLLSKSIKQGLNIQALLDLWPLNSSIVKLMTFTLSAVFVLTFIQRMNAYPNRYQDLNIISEPLVNFLNTSPELSNNFAWALVQNTKRTQAELALASDVMQGVISNLESADKDFNHESKAGYLDTYASVKFLQKAFDEAIEAEYQAIRYNENSYFQSQLSRFVYARARALGPYIVSEIPTKEFVIKTTTVAKGQSALVIQRAALTSAAATSALVHVVFEQQRKGYFMCHFVDADMLILSAETMLFGRPRESFSYPIDAVSTQWLDEKAADSCRLIKVDGLDGIVPDSVF